MDENKKLLPICLTEFLLMGRLAHGLRSGKMGE